jgi:hypothetical protein
MKQRLRTRGNLDVKHHGPGKVDSLRFEWIKRIPFTSFSYEEFIRVARELMALGIEYQYSEPLVDIRGFKTPLDCLELHDLNGSQDDEKAGELLNSRNFYDFESFTKEDYFRDTEPTVFLRFEGGYHAMVCLTARHGLSNSLNMFDLRADYAYSFISRNQKKRLSFYGQSLKPEFFEEIVRRYHRPSLTHSLSHPYIDDSRLNWFTCKLSPV